MFLEFRLLLEIIFRNGYTKIMNRDRRSRKPRNSSGSRSSYYGNRNREESESRRSNDSRSGRDGYSRGRGSRNEAKQKKPVFRSSYILPQEQISADEEAIRLYKDRKHCVCERCGLPIGDMGSAVLSKTTGNPIHFDCAIAILAESEKLEKNERITYIGQGRFGILNFPNIHDFRHFTIRKIIEWEDPKSERPIWRSEQTELYSQVR